MKSYRPKEKPVKRRDAWAGTILLSVFLAFFFGMTGLLISLPLKPGETLYNAGLALAKIGFPLLCIVMCLMAFKRISFLFKNS